MFFSWENNLPLQLLYFKWIMLDVTNLRMKKIEAKKLGKNGGGRLKIRLWNFFDYWSNFHQINPYVVFSLKK